MNEYPIEAAERLREYLLGHDLSEGIGNETSACSVAAINLALTNTLTDKIPECMSEVLGKWIIVIQDALPEEIRNSHEWKELLPLAAGTGRAHELERLQVIQDWQWEKVLPSIQPLANKLGFGAEWRTMCDEKTESAARSAARSAAESAAWSAARSAESAESAESAAIIQFWDDVEVIDTFRYLVKMA